MTGVAPFNNCGMSRAEARELTDQAKAMADDLWAVLLQLYEGQAHIALGYKTWGAYFEMELGGGSGSRGYQLLSAGRVLEALEPAGFRSDDDPGSPLLNEAAARELAPVLKASGAEAVRAAFEETVERHGPKPTAAQVREVVQDRQEPRPPVVPDVEPSWAARMRVLGGELKHIAAYRRQLESEDMRDHLEGALGLMADVTADLERLLA